jgi:hypothetical protein
MDIIFPWGWLAVNFYKFLIQVVSLTHTKKGFYIFIIEKARSMQY